MESEARFRDRAPKAWAGEGACRQAENELAREEEEEEVKEEEAAARSERVCAVRAGVQSLLSGPYLTP